MNAEVRELTKSVDAELLGRRIRRARHRAGLTQGQAAGDDVSTAYISRIEAGTRRPGPELLLQLAERLGCTAEELLAPEVAAPVVDTELVARLRLALDYAELSLRSGQASEALSGASDALAEAQASLAPADLVREARRIRALSLEAACHLDEAIIALEDLAADETDGVAWIGTLIALSRCYRESGDLARAADVGEQAVRRIDELGLTGTNEAVQLAVTVAAAHFERGDVNHAVRMCLRALQTAELLESPQARAAAYWNSSMMESQRGHVASALPLAEKAIRLLESSDDARNLARLRGELGLMQLRLDPPQASEAVANLTQSQRELEWTSASAADQARNQLGLAQATFLLGDHARAVELTEECMAGARLALPLVEAEAHVLLGRIAARELRADAAVASFRDAILVLSAMGADRSSAQLWFELASLLEDLGHPAEALDAYRRAAASSGLTAPARSAEVRQSV